MFELNHYVSVKANKLINSENRAVDSFQQSQVLARLVWEIVA